MFDKYFISEKEYVPYEKNVNINRAPTDESIKLYEEIKEKAYNSILESISLTNNILDVNAIIYNDLCSFRTICKYVLLLNGKMIEGEVEVSEMLEKFKDKRKIFKEIFKNASEHIAIEILKVSEKNINK